MKNITLLLALTVGVLPAMGQELPKFSVEEPIDGASAIGDQKFIWNPRSLTTAEDDYINGTVSFTLPNGRIVSDLIPCPVGVVYTTDQSPPPEDGIFIDPLTFREGTIVKSIQGVAPMDCPRAEAVAAHFVAEHDRMMREDTIDMFEEIKRDRFAKMRQEELQKREEQQKAISPLPLHTYQDKILPDIAMTKSEE